VLARPVRFHQEHVRLLEAGASTTLTQRLPVPAGEAAALRAVADAEQRLADKQLRLSMKARSGEVARLLAGLSAAAAQQAHVLGSAALR